MKMPRGDKLMPWILLALAVLVYRPALEAGFIWDDESHVTHLEPLRSVAGLKDIWILKRPPATPQYYPLTFTAFWLQFRLWGLNPWGYHLVNVLLHGGGGILVWKLCRRMRWAGAGLAAALFVAHPVMVMSVAWITELKNTLSGFLMLASLLAFCRHAGFGEEPGRPGAGRGLALSFLLYAAAVLAKTPAGILPLAFFLLAWMEKRPLDRRFWLAVLPFAAVGVVMGLVTVSVEQVMGTAEKEFQWPLADRVILAGRSFWFYLGKLLWPARLVFLYPVRDISHLRAGNYLFPLAVILLGVLLWRKRGALGRGPFAAFAWFFLAAPALAILHVLYMMQYTQVADHWQYFAAPAVLILAANGMARLASARSLPPRAAGAAAMLLVALLGLRTARQCRMYRDPELLWLATLAAHPGAWMAHNNLGQIYSHRGELEQAGRHYAEALRLDPGNPDALNNLATVWLKQGEFARAAEAFYRVLVRRPQELAPRNNLANVLALMGDKPGAVMHYRELLRFHPDQPFPQIHFILGSLLLELDEPAAAAEHFRRVLELEPDDAEARRRLDAALEAMENLEENAVPR